MLATGDLTGLFEAGPAPNNQRVGANAMFTSRGTAFGSSVAYTGVSDGAANEGMHVRLCDIAALCSSVAPGANNSDVLAC